VGNIMPSASEFQSEQPAGCVLYLFIAGSTLRSQSAVINLKQLCDEALIDVSELKIIDVFQQPALAKTEQIIAVPTLVKKRPEPKRFFIGDLSDKYAIVEAINS
jgi:circadian clock protein KaiB